jgi:hypothetical protein
MPQYAIARRPAPPTPEDHWNSPYWHAVKPLTVARFHPRSTRHRPFVQAKLAHSSDAFHILFRVEDIFIRAQNTELHSSVCRDSCVEAFLEPIPGKGYFNFEMNCGGTLLVFHVTDAKAFTATRGKDGHQKLAPEHAGQITITPSLKQKKPFELTAPQTWTVWTLQASIPTTVIEPYIGKLPPLEGQHWRGNFFKCGDDTKHPHWATWSPIGNILRFHQPEKFGDLYFKKIS